MPEEDLIFPPTSPLKKKLFVCFAIFKTFFETWGSSLRENFERIVVCSSSKVKTTSGIKSWAGRWAQQLVTPASRWTNWDDHQEVRFKSKYWQRNRWTPEVRICWRVNVFDQVWRRCEKFLGADGGNKSADLIYPPWLESRPFLRLARPNNLKLDFLCVVSSFATVVITNGQTDRETVTYTS